MSIEITPNADESLYFNASYKLFFGIYIIVIEGPVADSDVIDSVPRTRYAQLRVAHACSLVYNQPN